MEKETEKNNILAADFRPKPQKQAQKPGFSVSKQSNPILTKLLKLTHMNLSKDNEDYKSFSGFKPDDLK